MARMKRRELNEEESAEAQRLNAAWISFKQANKGVTQEWLGVETGLGTQGAVGQYLRGVIPLNVEALMAFARVLGVDPRSISSRLTDIVGDLLVRTNPDGGLAGSLKLSVDTAGELRVLSAYRHANERELKALEAIVAAVLDRLQIERRNEA